MGHPENAGTKMDDLCREVEQRFQLADLVLTSACNPGHVHDGRSCGLDVVAGDALVPGNVAEFVVELDPSGGSSQISRAWASGDCPTLVARVAAAYVSLEADPRLARALDEVDAKHLCDDYPEPCTLDEGVHSPWARSAPDGLRYAGAQDRFPADAPVARNGWTASRSGAGRSPVTKRQQSDGFRLWAECRLPEVGGLREPWLAQLCPRFAQALEGPVRVPRGLETLRFQGSGGARGRNRTDDLLFTRQLL